MPENHKSIFFHYHYYYYVLFCPGSHAHVFSERKISVITSTHGWKHFALYTHEAAMNPLRTSITMKWNSVHECWSTIPMRRAHTRTWLIKIILFFFIQATRSLWGNRKELNASENLHFEEMRIALAGQGMKPKITCRTTKMLAHCIWCISMRHLRTHSTSSKIRFLPQHPFNLLVFCHRSVVTSPFCCRGGQVTK